MAKIPLKILILLGIVLAGSATFTYAAAQPIFLEQFDEVPNGWVQSSCVLNDGRAYQTCFITTTDAILSSSPTAGLIVVHDTMRSLDGQGSTGVKYEKSFNVTSPGVYNVSAAMNVPPCDVCSIYGRLYVDETLLLERIGTSAEWDNPPIEPTTETNMIYLDSGMHKVVLENYNTKTYSGYFYTYFDDIKIVPVTVEPVNGTDKLDKKLAKYNSTITKINDTVSNIEILEQKLKVKQDKLAHLQSLLDLLYLQIIDLAPEGYDFPFKD